MPGLAGRLAEFVRALRAHGIPAGPGETADAAAALEVLGLDDRDLVREGLAAALVRRGGQRTVFDAAFDLYFPAGVGAPELARENPPRDREELREALAEALAEGDDQALDQLAGLAVDLLGQYGAGTGPGGGYSAHQTLDRLQPQTLIAQVLAAMRGSGSGSGSSGSSGSSGEFADRLTRDEIRRRVEGFRGRVRTEARRRAAELRGRERIAQHAIAPAADRVDFLLASRTQLAELRRTIQPLSRKLATRLAARRKRTTRGQIDLRRTLRRSLSTGGVPLRPAYRHRRPGRPEIILLCDLSGSVAGFANFTMLLVQALRDQFSKVRVFGFVDSTDEVTHLVDTGAADPEQLGARMLSEAAVVRWDGHSDYGRALGQFTSRWLDAVGPRTSVLILGDARTNGGDPNLEAVRAIRSRARHVHWLNPERRALWGTGDSAAPDYAELVEMHECRNAQQLGVLVTRLLPT
ncbi:vWA domain-containing protein [Amycolatopsis sp. VS8301801F10]|uniref:vWA domain-containing protein n=1 Tax=Amycolatopsis sp. VS8301801F10 TaxID=2652442 RepID=UPI0038FC8A76